MNEQPTLAQLRRAHPFGCSGQAHQTTVSAEVVSRRVLDAPVHRAEAKRVRATCGWSMTPATTGAGTLIARATWDGTIESVSRREDHVMDEPLRISGERRKAV